MINKSSIFMLFFLNISLITGCQYAPSADTERAALAHMHLGMAYLDQGQRIRAKQKLLYARTLAPNIPSIHSSLGYYYEQIGDIDDAEKSYRKAVSKDKKNGDAHNHLGVFLCRHKQQYWAADREFQKALADPQYTQTSEVLENAGLCRRAAGSREEARNYFLRAYRQNPHSEHALLELSEMALEDHNTTEALQWLNLYEENNPTAGGTAARRKQLRAALNP
jgi:type IV pilus assembly protein PilF